MFGLDISLLSVLTCRHCPHNGSTMTHHSLSDPSNDYLKVITPSSYSWLRPITIKKNLTKLPGEKKKIRRNEKLLHVPYKKWTLFATTHWLFHMPGLCKVFCSHRNRDNCLQLSRSIGEAWRDEDMPSGPQLVSGEAEMRTAAIRESTVHDLKSTSCHMEGFWPMRLQRGLGTSSLLWGLSGLAAFISRLCAVKSPCVSPLCSLLVAPLPTAHCSVSKWEWFFSFVHFLLGVHPSATDPPPQPELLLKKKKRILGRWHFHF